MKLLLPVFVTFLLGIGSVCSAEETSRTRIRSDLVRWLIKDIEKTYPMSREQMEDLNGNLRCETHDLDHEGVPEADFNLRIS